MEITIGRKDCNGDNEIRREFFTCPECKFEDILDEFSYCPNCGNKLKWEDEE